MRVFSPSWFLIYLNFKNPFRRMREHNNVNLPTSLTHINSITITAMNPINYSHSLRNWSVVFQSSVQLDKVQQKKLTKFCIQSACRLMCNINIIFLENSVYSFWCSLYVGSRNVLLILQKRIYFVNPRIELFDLYFDLNLFLQLSLAKINHVIYLSQFQLLLAKMNEDRTTSRKALL